MNNHPLDYILRKRKSKDLITDFDMICANNYFCGKFGQKAPIDKNREYFKHIIKLIKNENT